MTKLCQEALSITLVAGESEDTCRPPSPPGAIICRENYAVGGKRKERHPCNLSGFLSTEASVYACGLLGPCWVPRCVFFRGGALSIARYKVGGKQCAWVTADNPLTRSNHMHTHAWKHTEEHCGQVSQREKQKGGARGE